MSKLAILGSSGTSDPNRASLPFHIAANGAAASGVEVIIILAGDATELLRDGVAAGVQGLGIPPLAALFEKCAEANIPIHVCKGCAEARGVFQLGENQHFISAADVVRLTLEADRVLSF